MRPFIAPLACAIAAATSSAAHAVPQVNLPLSFSVREVFTRDIDGGRMTPIDDPSIRVSLRTTNAASVTSISGGGIANFTAEASGRFASTSGVATAIGGTTKLSVAHDVDLVFENLNDYGDLRFSLFFTYLIEPGRVDDMTTQYARAEYTHFNVGRPAEGPETAEGSLNFDLPDPLPSFRGTYCDTRELQGGRTFLVPICLDPVGGFDFTLFPYRVRYEGTSSVVVPIRIAFNIEVADVAAPASFLLFAPALVSMALMDRRCRRSARGCLARRSDPDRIGSPDPARARRVRVRD